MKKKILCRDLNFKNISSKAQVKQDDNSTSYRALKKNTFYKKLTAFSLHLKC